jgi:hypothetical protein
MSHPIRKRPRARTKNKGFRKVLATMLRHPVVVGVVTTSTGTVLAKAPYWLPVVWVWLRAHL